MYVLTLLLFVVFSQVSYAKDPIYFDYLFESVSVENSIDVSFKHRLGELSLDRFKVRPVSDNVSIEIGGVSSKSLWLLLPNLSETLEIMLVGNFFDTILYFEVLDTVTGIVYKTPSHRIISRSWFTNYIGRLNENIMKW